MVALSGTPGPAGAEAVEVGGGAETDVCDGGGVGAVVGGGDAGVDGGIEAGADDGGTEAGADDGGTEAGADEGGGPGACSASCCATNVVDSMGHPTPMPSRFCSVAAAVLSRVSCDASESSSGNGAATDGFFTITPAFAFAVNCCIHPTQPYHPQR